jgi:hypothetical protein
MNAGDAGHDQAVLERVISGGQTGVDRAALDVALTLGIPCGGWCPRGRRAEDGPIDARYPLQETPTREYPQRTEWNVRDSDGTLALTFGRPKGGTALTIRLAEQLEKPCLIVDLAAEPRKAVPTFMEWLRAHDIRTLNVAGPRETEAQNVGRRTTDWLVTTFQVAFARSPESQ